jgi:hypothetical protein
MSSSKVLECYNAIADMEVIIDGKVVDGVRPNALPSSVQTAHLPLRLLTPISRFAGPAGTTATTWNVSKGSGVNRVDWFVTELFLWDAVNQNVGIRAVSDPLLKYCATYLDVLAIGGLVLPDNCVVTSVSFRPDVIEYPLFSGQAFYGVVTNITIMEKIP